jgi:hypothetical protein
LRRRTPQASSASSDSGASFHNTCASLRDILPPAATRSAIPLHVLSLSDIAFKDMQKKYFDDPYLPPGTANINSRL